MKQKETKIKNKMTLPTQNKQLKAINHFFHFKEIIMGKESG
jgi:hypothetical protein